MKKLTQSEIREKLQKHNRWLNGEDGGEKADLRDSNLRGSDLRGSDLSDSDLSGSDLRGSDLSGSDLRGSDLSGSDLDFSCWPLWCGGLNVKIDDRLAIQLLFHSVQNALRSPYVSDDIKRVLGNKEVVDIANRFHRAEVARIEPYGDGMSDDRPKKLTLEDLAERIGKPVYDYYSQAWYIIDDVDKSNGTITMTDYTVFESEDGICFYDKEDNHVRTD